MNRAFAAAVAILALAGSPAAWGAEPAVGEYQAKSIFLYNFAEFVEWPEDGALSRSSTSGSRRSVRS